MSLLLQTCQKAATGKSLLKEENRNFRWYNTYETKNKNSRPCVVQKDKVKQVLKNKQTWNTNKIDQRTEKMLR